jgi:hypothetical protein
MQGSMSWSAVVPHELHRPIAIHAELVPALPSIWWERRKTTYRVLRSVSVKLLAEDSELYGECRAHQQGTCDATDPTTLAPQ